MIERDDIDVYKQYEPDQDSTEAIFAQRPVQIGIVNKGDKVNELSPTWARHHVVARRGVGAKTGLYKIGETIRKLSPRECARLQGFPDTFKITASPAQAYKHPIRGGKCVYCHYWVMIEQDIFDFQEQRMTINFDTKQQLGSVTAKGGFANEHDIVAKFQNYQTDSEAQVWLSIMGYELNKIDRLKALHIPTRLNQKRVREFGISPDKMAETQKYKKADIQVQLMITIDDIIYRENISLKKAKQSANFNQIDKRSVDTYQTMWQFNDTVANTLKKFTGATLPTDTEAENLRDKRRWYLDELPKRTLSRCWHFSIITNT